MLGDKHFIAYFDRFLCHANTPYFLRFIAEILDESNNYISRIKAWAYARKDLLLAEEENEIQRVFRRIHGIQGRLFHGHRLTDTARSKLPTPLVKIFDSFRSTSSKNVRKRVASSVVESLLGRSSSDTDSHHDMPVVESKTGLSERDKRRQVQEEERKFRRNNSGRRNEPVIIPRDESISISGPASEDPTQNILVHAGSDIRVSSEDPITVELNPVREVREDVAKILAPQQPKENPVKTLEDTVNFWIEALEGGRYTSENRGDVIMLRLKGAYVHRIHDIAFGTITIDTSGIMAPDIGEGDLSSKIHSIVHHLREEKQKEEIENELKEAEKALEGTQTLWGLAIADGDYSYEI